MQPTREQIQQAPKVLLHDHLDGGLRPATIIELAAGIGHAVPATTPETLADWFAESADSGSLERYLETFSHTVAVMQTADAITRVARESVEDLAADGVVYAESRYAPELMVDGGLSLEEVVAAVQRGFDEGMAAAAEAGRPIRVLQLLTAMRQAARACCRMAVSSWRTTIRPPSASTAAMPSSKPRCTAVTTASRSSPCSRWSSGA